MDTAQNNKNSKPETCPVVLSDEAISEFKRLMEEKQLYNEKLLRIGVKGGGCAGFSYILDFDTAQDNDEQYNYGGLELVINKLHKMYLEGMVIDYHTGLDARGFTFTNPNATETCGCGSSFSA